jgi:hypothetical protein
MSTDGPQPTQGHLKKKKKVGRLFFGIVFLSLVFFFFFFGPPLVRVRKRLGACVPGGGGGVGGGGRAGMLGAKGAVSFITAFVLLLNHLSLIYLLQGPPPWPASNAPLF